MGRVVPLRAAEDDLPVWLGVVVWVVLGLFGWGLVIGVMAGGWMLFDWMLDILRYGF